MSQRQERRLNAIDPETPQGLPVNIEAEQALLGSLLTNNAAFASVAGFLNAEHFHEPVHRDIFSAMAARIADGRPAGVLALAPDLRPFNDDTLTAPIYLARLAASAHTLTEVSGMARELVLTAAKRRLAGLAADIDDAIRVPGSSASDIVSGAESSLVSLYEEISRLDSKPSATPDSVFDDIERRVHDGIEWRGARSGFAALDHIIGGFAPGDYIVIAGRPSMGKTGLSLSLARRAAHMGSGVAYWSIEMSADQCWPRLITDEAEAAGHKLAYSRLMRGKIDRVDVETVRSAKDRLKPLPLRVIDRGDRLSDLVGHIRAARRWLQVKKGKDLDLFVVDYLGLMRPGNRYAGQRVNEVSEISATIKHVSKREGVPIIALHQLNRASEGRDDYRPRLSELRESGAIEQDADAVIFVHREEYYITRPGYRRFDNDAARVEAIEKSSHKMEAIVAKNRHGPTGTAHLWCEMSTNSVRDEAR